MALKYEERKDPLLFTLTHHLSPTPHIHKEIEMVYVFEGEVTAVADSCQKTIKNGEFFIAFPNQVHYYKDCAVGKYCLIIVSRHMLPGLSHDIKGHRPDSNHIFIGDNQALVNLLDIALKSSGKFVTAKKYGYLNIFMSDIIPLLSLTERTATDQTTIQKIIEFCHNNYTSEITLDDAAAELHLNKYYISHTISRQIGLSFSNYINSLRVDAACEMLLEDDAKIADIAGAIGFGSIRTFNRIFKEKMNMTPYAYRNMMLRPKDTL